MEATIFSVNESCQTTIQTLRRLQKLKPERSILVLNRRKRNAKRFTTKVGYEFENLTTSPPTNEDETGKIEPWIQQLLDALEDTQR